MVLVRTQKSSKNDMIRESQVRIPDTDHETLEHKERILKWLSRIGTSYLSEISWEANISEYQCKNIINSLRHQGFIERVEVDFNRPDPRLLSRVADQSATGQGGFESFSRKHWFAITTEGRAYLETP